jgi:hypothetical protein
MNSVAKRRKMMINSRAKGKRAELAFANVCREHGYEARREKKLNGSLRWRIKS